jgi:hypothetical protein
VTKDFYIFRKFILIFFRLKCKGLFVSRLVYTRWFKYDRDYLCVNKSQFVPVIFEPPCILSLLFIRICCGGPSKEGIPIKI